VGKDVVQETGRTKGVGFEMIGRTEYELLLPEAVGKARGIVTKILKRFPDDVEDVLQDTSLKALARIHQYRGRASFSTWFCRIAINASLMRLRNFHRPIYRMRLPSEETESGEALLESIPDKGLNPEELMQRVELRMLLERTFEKLTFRERQALWLMQYGYGTNEVSKRLGHSVESSKSVRFHARHKARRILSEENVQQYL
jgi:RNA polymerase sigma-70 factor (ECF subfamily)